MTGHSFKSEEIAPGTLVAVRRLGYRHYGICAGSGRVIHYAGLLHYPNGLIEETSLTHFAHGRELAVGPEPVCGDAVLHRARSRLGERRYDLFTNNCEHFSNWCQTGQHHSPQAETLRWPARVLVRLIHTVFAGSVQKISAPGTFSAWVSLSAWLFKRAVWSPLCVEASSPAVRSGRCTRLDSARDNLDALAPLPRTHWQAQLL